MKRPTSDMVQAVKLPTCPECERVFDMTDDIDAYEYFYGHDCE